MNDEPTDLIRPVRCYFCREQMHYRGQPHYVPEVRVEVHRGGEGCDEFYAHVSCWNAFLKRSERI